MKLYTQFKYTICTLVFSFAVASCGGGGGDGASLLPPDVNLTGNWNVVESITSSNCPTESTELYSVSITQDGNALTVDAPDGAFSGQISGSSINWSGSYVDNSNSTISANVSLTVNASGNQITGAATWTATYVGGSCNGSSSVVVDRTSGVSTLPNEIEPNQINSPQQISVPTEINGQVSGAKISFAEADLGTLGGIQGFDSGEDYDAFVFTPASNGIFSFNLVTNGEDLDLYLLNLDSDTLIAFSNEPGGIDENINNLIADTTNTFVVMVLPWDLNLASGNGNYTLTISQQ